MAQKNLGLRYADGQGVAKDAVIAYALFNLAAAGGNKGGQENRSKMAEQLTPRQLEEGQALSSAWKLGTPLPAKRRTWGAAR